MNTDLATCEWSPGSNRSVVSIEVAAERIPQEYRAILIEKHNSRQIDDQVLITRYSIVGAEGYQPNIYDMNFSTGRLCYNVTRNNWESRHATAIVYWINETVAYGWASDCGNLFRIVRVPSSLGLLDRTRTIKRELELEQETERLTVLQRWYRSGRKVNTVPEPGTLVLTLPMFLALLFLRRRKK